MPRNRVEPQATTLITAESSASGQVDAPVCAVSLQCRYGNQHRWMNKEPRSLCTLINLCLCVLQRRYYDTTGQVKKSASEAFVEGFAGGEVVKSCTHANHTQGAAADLAACKCHLAHAVNTQMTPLCLYNTATHRLLSSTTLMQRWCVSGALYECDIR